jgi:hypothetical protein
MSEVRSSRPCRWMAIGAAVIAGGTLVAVQAADAGGIDSPSAAQSFANAVEARSAQGVATAGASGKQANSYDDAPARRAEPTGSTAAALEVGATFIPINPYRAYDSRPFANGFLPRNAETYFDVITD